MVNPRGPYLSHDAKMLTALLEHLYHVRYLPMSSLQKFFQNKDFKKEATQEKIKRITNYLNDSSLPVSMDKDTIVWEGLFARGLARRRSFQFPKSKERLAKCVVKLLEKQQPRSILLGAGTTVLAVVRELIARINELSTLQEFYTNNLIALSELLLHGGQINIHVPEGCIVTRDGSIIGNDGIEQLKEKKFDAIITSFYGFHPDTGFHSDHEGDRAEKLMNLVQNNCSTIYIVFSWEKFGAHHTNVATLDEAFSSDKKYYVVTDPPQEWVKNKTDEIEKKTWRTLWDKKNIEIVYAEPVND